MKIKQIADMLGAYWAMEDGSLKDKSGKRIARIPEAKIIPACLRLLKHSDPELRWQAINFFQPTASILIPDIIAALVDVASKDELGHCRAMAISTLREYSGRYEGLQSLHEQVQALTILALSDPDAQVREVAAQALSYSGVRAVPALIRALEDTDDEVRTTAANTLGTLDAPQAIDALAKVYASDSNPETRFAALSALSELEYDSVSPHLLRALRDTDARIREQAAEALDHRKYLSKACYRAWEQMDCGAIYPAQDEEDEAPAYPPMAANSHETPEDGEPREEANAEKRALSAFDLMCSALQAPDAGEQMQAIQALEDTRDERAIPHLLEAVLSENAEVSVRACKAMESFAPNVVNEHILLQRNRLSLKCPAFALPLLKNVINDDAVSFSAKCSLIEELGNRGDDTLPLLLLALENDSEYVRKAAATVFINRPHPDAFTPLLAALQDEAPMVRAEAALACSAVGGLRAVEPLRAQLQIEAFPFARERIVLALGELDDPRAIDAIRQCLQEANRFVHAMAMRVLRHDAVSVFHAAMQDLRSTDHRERENAIYVLRDIFGKLARGHQDKIERTLLVLMNDPETFVVRAVASAFGEILTSDTLEALSKLADHAFPDIREHALAALCMIDHERALERTLRALTHDEDARVRGRVARRLGHYRLMPKIKEVLEDALVREMNLETRRDIQAGLEECHCGTND